LAAASQGARKAVMAVLAKSVSSVEALAVNHKSCEYTLIRYDDGLAHIPFAYATTISPGSLRALAPAERIPFLRQLRPNQVAPTMVMKMRLASDGAALNAQGCADGKTTQAYWIVSQLSPRRTLVVVHRLGLAEQWITEGAACMGVAPWRAEEPETVGEDARVVVVMVHVMHRLPKTFLRSVDLLIVDECDRVAGPVHGLALLLCTPKRTLGLTATPGELNSRSVDPVVSLIFGVKPILPGARKPFKVVRVNYPFKPTERQHWFVDKNGKRKQGLDWALAMNSSARCHQRNVDAVRLVRMLLEASPDNKVFVLVKYKYNVDELERIAKSIGWKKNEDYALVYGDEDVSTICCCRVYWGTYAKGEAGFDEKGLRGFVDGETKRVNHVILLADVLDPRQGIGRGFRAEMPFVWEFLDDNEIVRGPHAAQKEKWYTENGVLSIKTVELEDLDLGEDIDIEPPPFKAPSTAKRVYGGAGGTWRGRGGGSWRGRGATRGGGRGGRGASRGYKEPP
jgi:hypothetical protein